MTVSLHDVPTRPDRPSRGHGWPLVLVVVALVSLGLVASVVVAIVVHPWADALRGGAVTDPNRPRYDVHARVDPASGRVDGRVAVRVPADVGGKQLRFRVVPNAAGYDAGFELGRVTVDGDRVEPRLSGALLTVPRGADGGVDVTIDFAYRVVEGQRSPLAALGLLPSDGPLVAGLLARYDTGVSMGHWYPFLVADGATAASTLPAVGDVGNAPLADVRAKITVPRGYTVISGGETERTRDDGGHTVVEERANGIRELSLVVSNMLEPTTVEESGVQVRVWAPKDAAADADEVAKITARALGVFEESFGRYRWPSVDVVQAPMPPGVGGIEWQGMFWVGSELFRGALPGVPGPFGELVGKYGGVVEAREFTVVHELAHQWWQGMVGVDQLTDEVVDEPLAQYSSCLYFAETQPREWQRICDRNTSVNYRYMRTSGVRDAAADRPTSAFTDDKQYAGVVYGKAPGFYRALERLEGRQAVLAGLRQLVEDGEDDLVDTDTVIDALSGAAPRDKRAQVPMLWRHWMHETHGDQDVGTKLTP